MMQQDMQKTEVRETTTQTDGPSLRRQAVDPAPHTSGVVIIQRFVWFIVGAISTIIALRFVLLLLGASREVAFTDFIYTLSSPLVAPFVGIFGKPTYGQSVFEISSVLAIVIYLLIGWGFAKLVTIARPQDEL